MMNQKNEKKIDFFSSYSLLQHFFVCVYIKKKILHISLLLHFRYVFSFLSLLYSRSQAINFFFAMPERGYEHVQYTL